MSKVNSQQKQRDKFIADYSERGYAAVGATSERDDGIVPTPPPATRKDWLLLLTKTDEELEKMGLVRWDENLMLLPKEWYDSIPEGVRVTNVMGETEPFSKENIPYDYRLGMLAYGIPVCSDPETRGRWVKIAQQAYDNFKE